MKKRNGSVVMEYTVLLVMLLVPALIIITSISNQEQGMLQYINDTFVAINKQLPKVPEYVCTNIKDNIVGNGYNSTCK